MNTETNQPPLLLPNGKTNPEYTRWYRSTESGKAAMKKYQSSDKAKAARKKYLSSEHGNARAKTTRKEYVDGLFPGGRLTCVECGIVYDMASVVGRGWRLIGRGRCLCDLCQ